MKFFKIKFIIMLEIRRLRRVLMGDINIPKYKDISIVKSKI